MQMKYDHEVLLKSRPKRHFQKSVTFKYIQIAQNPIYFWLPRPK